MVLNEMNIVIPAQAGIQRSMAEVSEDKSFSDVANEAKESSVRSPNMWGVWIPACAGMTSSFFHSAPRSLRLLYVFIMTALLLIFSPSTFASVSAFVDRNPVALDESFTLTVESDGSGGSKPDFSVLDSDFDVMGQSSNSSIQIINGQMSRKQQWQVGLMAKHAGEIEIPAFEVGGEQSQPLKLTVVEGKQSQQSQQESNLFMEVSAEPTQLYVQQQLIYTVRLYYAVNIGDSNTLSEPKVTGGDAIVEKLGDAHQFQTTLNGRRYGVVEQKYAIYPQKSGQLTIEPVVFDGSVVEQQGRNNGFFFDPFNQATRHVRLRSKGVKLDVQPVPAGITKQWLPASNLQLLEQWSEDPPKFVVGEPITRTLAVMADGLTAAQLPAIGSDLPDGVKSYPDQPQLKDTKGADGITGLRQQKIALIPTQPGKLTLPAIELGWWNTEKKKLEIARIPARTVTVAPGAGMATQQPANVAPQPQPQTESQSQAAPQPEISNAPTAGAAKSTATVVTAGWWPWISLALGVAWLITLIAWWRSRRGHVVQTTGVETSSSQQQLRPLELQLKKVCQQNSAQQSKAALLAWAKARWPQQPPVSLPAIAKQCPPQLAEAISELDRVLYAGGEVEWQGQHLWQMFEQHKPVIDTANRSKGEGLEPLYRA